MFARSGTAWAQEAQLLAADGAPGDFFGHSVSLDGDTLLVGAIHDDDAGADSGSAYVFERTGTTWAQTAKLVAAGVGAGDSFGFAVSLHGDTAVISAPRDDDFGIEAGAVYVFERAGTVWGAPVELRAFDGFAYDLFGISVALSGDTLLVGSYLDDAKGPESGSA